MYEERERETDRQTDRQRQRERDRERETERDREKSIKMMLKHCKLAGGRQRFVLAKYKRLLKKLFIM